MRTAADRCPGLLRPSAAADGALIRLRMPGGMTTADTLVSLIGGALAHADGTLQITSRANVQLRGILLDEAGDVPAELSDVVVRAGLLPSPPHERIRNIVASPLSGLSGGLADVRHVVGELDRLLCASARLASLPGRFLFCLDDGRGDVATLKHDLGLRAVSATRAQLTVAGAISGPEVDLADAAGALVALAGRFLDQTPGAGDAAPWHVSELAGSGTELLDQVGAAPSLPGADDFSMPYGAIEQSGDRMALSLLVPLGLLDAEHVQAVAEVAGSGPVILTPWRGLVLGDVPATAALAGLDRLERSGLVTDASTGWTGLTACTGAPGCNRAAVSTRHLARLIADGVPGPAAASSPPAPVHVVACERRCGAPATSYVDVLATSAGVAVTRDGRTVTPTAAQLVATVDDLRSRR